MTLTAVSISELVVAAAGKPRFRVKYMPTLTVRAELHTEKSHEIGLFCIADDERTFVLGNRWIGGDEWSSELQDYTAPIWETVALRSTAGLFDEIPTGAGSTYKLEWPDGVISWNTVGLEVLAIGEEPVLLAVEGARVAIIAFDGKPYEFITELWLVGTQGNWQLKRSTYGPDGYTLVRGEPTY